MNKIIHNFASYLYFLYLIQSFFYFQLIISTFDFSIIYIVVNS